MTAYRNRIKEYRTVASADLVRNPANFRRHPEHQRSALRGLLERVGRVAPLLAYEQDGELLLLDGHARLDEAAEWDVAILDIDVDEAATVLTMLDKIGADAEIDAEALMALLDSLPAEARQTAGAAWSDEELAAIIQDTSSVPWEQALGALPAGDRAPFQQMTFTLSDEQAEQVKAAMERAQDVAPFVDTGNENSNGNALARICEAYLG